MGESPAARIGVTFPSVLISADIRSASNLLAPARRRDSDSNLDGECVRVLIVWFPSVEFTSPPMLTTDYRNLIKVELTFGCGGFRRGGLSYSDREHVGILGQQVGLPSRYIRHDLSVDPCLSSSSWFLESAGGFQSAVVI